MVSSKNKVSYAERVLGAFSHLQKEHRKHDIHLASLRAQIKRHAEAKKDTLGPHWTHWVSKAITKLESEGILEHTVPGSVALTSDGKKAVTDARRSLQIGSPQKGKDNDDLIWKQITSTASRGVKRPRKSIASNRGDIDSESEDDTASRANKTPRKRPRAAAVGSSPRKSPQKSPSKLTKLELQQELASVKRAYAAAIRRPSSPLTDLSDEDDDHTADLKEKLKERDQAIENMRRDLALARKGISRGEENQAAGRSNTPNNTLNFDHMSSPLGAATKSRPRTADMTRTQSGSYILNLSKQPTPAPSPQGRDGDYEQVGDYGVENTDMAVDNNEEALPPLGNAPELAVVTTLKSEIQDLKKRVAANLVIISSKETEISDLEKDISDHARLHESTISDRDATIASLGEKVSELKAEVNDLRESCRVAKETTTRLTMQLQATEASVSELEAEADVSKTKLGVLEMSNANLLHDQEAIKLDLEQAKAKCIEAENTTEHVRHHAKTVSEELSSLKILQDEQLSKIEGLVESLARTSSDAQAMREKSRMLEASVAKYEAEIQEKEDIRQNLEIQVKQNDSRIAQLSADVQTVEILVEDMRTRLGEANKKAADAESLNEKLTTELSLKDGAVQQYQEDFVNIQGQFTDSQLQVAEWTTKHANDTMTLSSTISELRDALATANGDVERLTSQLQAVEYERLNIRQDLVRKEVDLLDAVNVLDRERKVKLAAEADLNTYVSKTQELEKELGYFKTSKEADEATISSLRALFTKLRQLQLQLHEDVEQEVVDVCSSAQSMPQRSLL